MKEVFRCSRNVGYTERRVLDDGWPQMQQAAAPTSNRVLGTQEEEQSSVTSPLEPEPIPDGGGVPGFLRIQSSVRASLDG